VSWLASPLARRVFAVAVGIVVAIGVTRVVSSLRGNADDLRARHS
jgi:hypothetical protein